jgi:dTDP-4-dehydrorhamnose reductase (EC 1.1.1.133)
MTNILVTGSDGQLGSEIQAIASHWMGLNFTFTTINELDITDEEAVNNILSTKPFQFLINCSAYTAVDKAETDRANAFLVNAQATKILAKACKNNQTRMIHVSTDYVFDGQSCTPYKEDQTTNPKSVYGESKLLGENYLTEHQPDSIIIRTSWLYSVYGNNFVKTILKYGREREELKVVFDQIGTPTHAADLAQCILTIVNTAAKENRFYPGVYHFSNEGVTSWYDFAVQIAAHAKLSCKIRPVESSEYPTQAARPFYSVLNKSKIKSQYHVEIPHWTQSLNNCLNHLLITTKTE